MPEPIPPPTYEDRAIDLASAYGDILGRLEGDLPFDVGGLVVAGVAAIRRAIAAEACVKELEAELRRAEEWVSSLLREQDESKGRTFQRHKDIEAAIALLRKAI